MPTRERTFAVKARWVFPVETAPVHDGIVTIDGRRIVAVGRAAPRGCQVTDLGSVAIVPGLVNAHAHLEFSGCEAPLGRPGAIFPEWIRTVTELRGKTSAEMTRQAIGRGLCESIAGGTTLLGEIATSALSVEQMRDCPLRATVFWEVICFAVARFNEALARLDVHLAPETPAARWQVGISPHAPYTVHPELFARLVDLSARSRHPIAFHLAESLDELELLRSGTGPLVDYLVERGFWVPGAIALGTRPLDYLQRLTHATRTLVIHGNYLDHEEVALLAANADRFAVIYCPRTHAYFGHARYPLERLLAAGVTVALGTDSRASNPDLSLLAEMRFVARHFPALPLASVLGLGTLAGARALGLADVAGSLAAGKSADLVAIPIGDHEPRDPHELLFDGELPAVRTMIGGTWIETDSVPRAG